MATAQGRQVTVTIPEDAPPGTVLSIPVKDDEPVQIRVPPGLGPGSQVLLMKFDADGEWLTEVGIVVPPPEEPRPEASWTQSGEAEGGVQRSQEELAALWHLQQQLQQPCSADEEEEKQRVCAANDNASTAASGISEQEGCYNFKPASVFEGPMLNYTFKKGDSGLGYYRDASDLSPPQTESEPQQGHAWSEDVLTEQERQLEQQRRDEEQELRLLQEQQLRLQQQRREEEMQRQRLRTPDQERGRSQGFVEPTCVQPQCTLFQPEVPQMINSGEEIAYTVRLDTSVGDLDIIIRPDWAPHGAKRFLELVAAGEFDDLYFYRAIEGCIAQFGLPVKRKWDPIPDDVPCGVPFLHGAVCFAALAENSRRSTLFVCTGDMTHCLGQKPWETVIGAIAESSLNVLDLIHTSYGDIHEFGGAGPDTGRITAEGNAYLRTYFPKLTRIRSSRPLDWEPENPQDISSRCPTGPGAELTGDPSLPRCGAATDPAATAAEIAREAQEEAAKAALLAASATTTAQADAAAELAQKAAELAQQAQEAASAAQAQVQAARSRLQQKAPSTPSSAKASSRPVVVETIQAARGRDHQAQVESIQRSRSVERPVLVETIQRTQSTDGRSTTPLPTSMGPTRARSLTPRTHEQSLLSSCTRMPQQIRENQTGSPTTYSTMARRTPMRQRNNVYSPPSAVVQTQIGSQAGTAQVVVGASWQTSGSQRVAQPNSSLMDVSLSSMGQGAALRAPFTQDNLLASASSSSAVRASSGDRRVQRQQSLQQGVQRSVNQISAPSTQQPSCLPPPVQPQHPSWVPLPHGQLPQAQLQSQAVAMPYLSPQQSMQALPQSLQFPSQQLQLPAGGAMGATSWPRMAYM
jgi:cyclophilin family peptidyl-prolyl cis-trans isomerase